MYYSRYLRTLLLSLALIASVSSFYVIPLRAGTIYISDYDLRQNKILKQQIDINLTKEAYDSHKDTNVIAAITQLDMDDKLSFYFEYNIFCPSEQCLLNFTVVRKSQNVNTQFAYSVQVDYLVARGLKILQLNMTSYQEHLYLKFINSYNQKNQKENLGLFQPRNNADAMRIMAIPNGFSNLTRTGRVVYLYTMNEDMYVMHYMEHENGHGEHDAMGWPEGADYIRYKVMFFDATYLPNGCKHDDQWALTQSYTHRCGENETKWFFGFKSTKEKSIKAQMVENMTGYSCNLTDTEKARYGVLGFPFQNNPQFIDLRQNKYVKVERTNYSLISEAQPNSSYVIVSILILLVLIFLLITKICQRSKVPKTAKKQQNFNSLEGRSETFNSAREEGKSIENVIEPKI